MEVWALEGFGAAYTLQEILTIKSDDIYGRQQIMNYLFKGKPIQVGRPESFRVLIRELQALCLAVQIFDYPVKDDSYYRRDPIDLDSANFNQY
jgi:DNA-directed RNA polymerase subunit beta